MSKAVYQKNHIDRMESLSGLPDFDSEPRFRVKVKSNEELAQDVFVILLSRPKEFKFNAGQYVWIVLPKLTKQYGAVDRRAYSISSSTTNNDTLEFLIRDSNSEYISKLKSLKAGDEIEIIGPMGSAFSVPNDGVIMISGGTGISPFLSVLRSNLPGKLSLVAYDSRDLPIYKKDELDELSRKYGYEILYRKAIPRRPDFNSIVSKSDERLIFVSGSKIFVNYVTTILLKRGIKADRLCYEENYPQTKADKNIKNTLLKLFSSRDLKVKKGIPGTGDLFFQVTSQISSHVALTDANGHILFSNQAATDMTGYTLKEMLGQTPRLWGGLWSSVPYKTGWSLLKGGKPVKGSAINRRRNGELYVAIVTVTPVKYKGRVIMHVATEEDVTYLYNVDKTKTEFVSFASHQLRAPLSITGWYAEMLLSGDAGKLNKEQLEYVKEINASGKRMSELIGALLDVSRLELGTFVIEPEPADLIKLAEDVIKEQKNTIDKRKTHFSFSFSKNIPSVNGDIRLLRMIIQNLLSNAIKYTPDDGSGKVQMSLSLDKRKKIILKVTDNGIGIPKSQKNKIFTKLFRADNAIKKNSDGTGLGLYIIKSVLRKTGGKIWFESAENKGTTFYAIIPKTMKATKKKS